MSISPTILLRQPGAFLDLARRDQLAWRDLLALTGFILLGCGVYGAILAGWRSPLLSLYVAIKLPVLFLLTALLVSVFNWMLSSLLGAGLSYRTTLFLVFAAMAQAAWLLLALAPVALFFLVTGVARDGSAQQLQYAHNCMLVTHIVILAITGIMGNVTLFRGMKRLIPANRVKSLFVSWLTAYAFVGCQMSWILRPFVGSPFYPVVFMRPDCMERNFYEFVFGEVLPYILRGGN